jgi:hypothetical protein
MALADLRGDANLLGHQKLQITLRFPHLADPQQASSLVLLEKSSSGADILSDQEALCRIDIIAIRFSTIK